jgi:hypothetical protein
MSFLTFDLRELEHADLTEVAFAVHAYVRLVATLNGQNPDANVLLVNKVGRMFQGPAPLIRDPQKGRPGFGGYVADGSANWCISWEAGPYQWACRDRPLGMTFPDWCIACPGEWSFQLVLTEK